MNKTWHRVKNGNGENIYNNQRRKNTVHWADSNKKKQWTSNHSNSPGAWTNPRPGQTRLPKQDWGGIEAAREDVLGRLQQRSLASIRTWLGGALWMKPPPQDAGGAFSPKLSLKPPKDGGEVCLEELWERAPGLPGLWSLITASLLTVGPPTDTQDPRHNTFAGLGAWGLTEVVGGGGEGVEEEGQR